MPTRNLICSVHGDVLIKGLAAYGECKDCREGTVHLTMRSERRGPVRAQSGAIALFGRAGSLLGIRISDDLTLVPALALATIFWSRAYDFLLLVPHHSPVQDTVLSQHGGADLTVGPRRRCSGIRCEPPDVRNKLCAVCVLPYELLMRRGMRVAGIVVD